MFLELYGNFENALQLYHIDSGVRRLNLQEEEQDGICIEDRRAYQAIR